MPALSKQQMTEEIIKCSASPEYYLLNYGVVRDPKGGYVKFQLYDFQKDCLREFQEHRFNIILKSRQLGISTIAAGYIAWLVAFHKATEVAVVANKQVNSSGFVRKIKLILKKSPTWLVPKLLLDNQGSIELINGSRVIAHATTDDAARSESLTLLVIDEAAAIPTNKVEDLWAAAYPTLSMGGAGIVISCVTPDTYIYTDRGIKQIGDYANLDLLGEQTVASYGVLGKDKLRTGSIAYNNGVCKTKIISTRSAKLEGSLNHKLWAFSNKVGRYDWFQLRDLEVNDFVAVQYGMNVWGNNDTLTDFRLTPDLSTNTTLHDNFLPTVITPDLAYLLGVYIANGSMSIINSQQANELIGGYVSFVSITQDMKDRFTLENVDIQTHTDNIFTTSKNFIEFLLYLGFKPDTKNTQRSIPPRLLELSGGNLGALVNGIFDCKGFSRADRGIVSIGLSSKVLIDQIRIILDNIGILSEYGAVNGRNSYFQYDTIQYRLTLNQSESKLFYELIGFNSQEKQDNQNVLPMLCELPGILLQSQAMRSPIENENQIITSQTWHDSCYSKFCANQIEQNSPSKNHTRNFAVKNHTIKPNIKNCDGEFENHNVLLAAAPHVKKLTGTELEGIGKLHLLPILPGTLLARDENFDDLESGDVKTLTCRDADNQKLGTKIASQNLVKLLTTKTEISGEKHTIDQNNQKPIRGKMNCFDVLYDKKLTTGFTISQKESIINQTFSKNRANYGLPDKLLTDENASQNQFECGSSKNRAKQNSVQPGFGTELAIARNVPENFEVENENQLEKKCRAANQSNITQTLSSKNPSESFTKSNIVKSSSHDVIPNGVYYCKCLFDLLPFGTWTLIKKWGLNINGVLNKKSLYKTHHTSRQNLLKLKNICLQNTTIPNKLTIELDKILSPNVKWEPIRSITVSSNPTVDFSLPSTKNSHKISSEISESDINMISFWDHSVIYNSILGHQTPKGVGNWYHKQWTLAVNKESDFNPITIHWTEHPLYSENLEWICASCGNRQLTGSMFNGEVLCEICAESSFHPTSSWYENQKRQLASDRLIAQELDMDFLGSGDMVIENKYILEAEKECRKPLYEGFEVLQYHKKEDVPFSMFYKNLWVWEDPIEGEEYLICADVARGDSSDYSAFHVINSSDEQVAEYRHRLPPDEYAGLLYDVGTLYNNALIVPEANSIGYATCLKLVDLDYKNLFYSQKGMYSKEKMKKMNDHPTKHDVSAIPGFQTTNTSRPLIISALEEGIRVGSFKIRSTRTISELRTLVWINGKPQAMPGYNDDLCIAGGIGLFVKSTHLKDRSSGREAVVAALKAMQGESNLAENSLPTNRGFMNSRANPNPWVQIGPRGERESLTWLIDRKRKG